MIDKKNARGLTLLIICFLGVSANVYADKDDTLRKLLGLGGACLAVKGLFNVGEKPVQGIGLLVAGTAISVGGVCSDLILKKIKEGKKKEEPCSASPSVVQQVVADMKQSAKTFTQEIIQLGSDVYAKHRMAQGWDNFSSGNFLTGLEQMYDGVYHGIRAACKKTLQ